MDAKKKIERYLQDMARQDPNFKVKFEDKSKNIDECLSFIKSEAKKQASNGCAVIDDDVVFGWAAHYYQEDQLEVDKDENLACVVNISKKPKKAKKKPVAMELDLFGGTI
jgi:hypothetical protein